MTPEYEDRTEAPTPRRLREARKKGQVAVSRDLASALVALAAAGGLALLGPALLSGLRSGLTQSLSGLHEVTAIGSSKALLATMVGGAAPLAIFLLAAGAAAWLAQVGFLFTAETIRLKPERLDPFEGLRRFFSMRTFIAVAGGLAKGAVIVATLAASLWQERAVLAGLSARPLPEALGILVGTAGALFWKTALALLALGLVDWGYRRWQHQRDLRMSRREIEEELKEFEGDPAIRDRRRAHRERLKETEQISKVGQADVVVTDAGEIAVALALDPEAGPLVLARGSGATADRIREAALGHGVPVMERADLAKALHRDGLAANREAAADAIAVGREMKGVGRHDD